MRFRYDTTGSWLKGNTHIHSTSSDGGKTPGELAELYASAGYDFLWDGEQASTVEAQEGLLPGVVPAVVIMLFIIVALFNAVRPPADVKSAPISPMDAPPLAVSAWKIASTVQSPARLGPPTSTELEPSKDAARPTRPAVSTLPAPE